MPSESCAVHDHPTLPERVLTAPSVRARAARMLAAAGDPARLQLLELLDAGELCVSDLVRLVGDSMPAVSQRLRLLRVEGLIDSRRDGKHVFYRLRDGHVQELVLNILRHAAEPAR
jgi:DNA-binding transcriptional ArsR family regulator